MVLLLNERILASYAGCSTEIATTFTGLVDNPVSACALGCLIGEQQFVAVDLGIIEAP